MGIGDAFILFIGACSSETLMSHSVYMCAGISGKDLEERDGGFPSSYQYHFWVAIEVRLRWRCAHARWRRGAPGSPLSYRSRNRSRRPRSPVNPCRVAAFDASINDPGRPRAGAVLRAPLLPWRALVATCRREGAIDDEIFNEWVSVWSWVA